MNTSSHTNDAIFDALDPQGKKFLRRRILPPYMNPYAETFSVSALVAFGEFPHIKTVPAFQMMLEDCQNGLYVDKHTIVVDSSGNTAQAVARLAASFGFQKVVVVMAVDVPAAKQNIFRALSTVEVINVDRGKSVAVRAIEEAEKPGYVHLNQYAHLGNAHAHELYTGPEIARVLDGNIGIIAIAIGSGGTATGVARYMKQRYPQARVIGVHPTIDQQVPGARDVERWKSVVPDSFRAKLDAVVTVSRRDAFIETRRLWSAVEPQPGPTSGLAYAGLMQYLSKLSEQPGGLDFLAGRNTAFLCPDSATLYSDVMIAELDAHQGLF